MHRATSTQPYMAPQVFVPCGDRFMDPTAHLWYAAPTGARSLCECLPNVQRASRRAVSRGRERKRPPGACCGRGPRALVSFNRTARCPKVRDLAHAFTALPGLASPTTLSVPAVARHPRKASDIATKRAALLFGPDPAGAANGPQTPVEGVRESCPTEQERHVTALAQRAAALAALAVCCAWGLRAQKHMSTSRTRKTSVNYTNTLATFLCIMMDDDHLIISCASRYCLRRLC
jgi:hypothetical protein